MTPAHGFKTLTHRQQGAATLVVVMVLFFIMALAAIAAGRNQLFDSRIAANYARTEVAVSTTEAAFEWLTVMLNSGKLSTACTASSSGPDTFVQRYFTFSGTRRLTPRMVSVGGSTNGPMCYYSSGSWNCSCPQNGLWAKPASVPDTSDVTPSFDLLFGRTEKEGTLVAISTACTVAAAGTCNPFTTTGSEVLGFTMGASWMRAHQDYVLVSALKVPPASPLIAQGTVDWGPAGSSLALQNPDTVSHGVLAQLGGVATGSTADMLTLPGTPAADAILSDASLSLTSRDWNSLFQLYFGMLPASYQRQPAIRTITNCPASGDCTPLVDTLITAGHRMIWISGPANFTSAASWGSATDPVVLIVDGALAIGGTFQSAGVLAVNGQLSWAAGGASQHLGAIIVAGPATFGGSPKLIYAPSTLRKVADRMGSYVRLPGALLTDRSN